MKSRELMLQVILDEISCVETAHFDTHRPLLWYVLDDSTCKW